MFRILLIATLTFTLYANEHLTEADDLFEQKEYEKAYVLYTEIANKDKDSKAAFKLGWMYEKGKGAPLNSEQAIFWYKKAAQWDSADTDRAKALETYYRTFDAINDSESAETIMQYVSGSFAVRAYKTNYAVISYMDTLPQGDTVETEYINMETKFQLSIRGDYISNLFGASQIWTVAYTQTSYWQLFVTSEPFRETNYQPEAFVAIPFYHKLDAIAMKGASFGFRHHSNGQQQYSDINRTSPSRSWNRLYVSGYFQWNKLFANLTLWYPIHSTGTLTDNADIVDYYGYGSLELNYTHKKLLSRLTGRYNTSTDKGSAELEFTYPVGNSKKVFYYLQGFTGYGQSLIDYHTYVNQVGFGISLSR